MISQSALNCNFIHISAVAKVFFLILIVEQPYSYTRNHFSFSLINVYWPLHQSNANSISLKSVFKVSTSYLQLLSARMGMLDGNSLVHVTLRTFVAAFHAFIVQPLLFTYVRLYFLLASLKPLRWLEERFEKSMQGENVKFFIMFEAF